MAGIIPCVIRWDPWYATDSTAIQAQWALSPAQWRYRAPWFATFASDYYFKCVGSQANVDLEIRLAAAAGIKAFAQVWYGGHADGSTAEGGLNAAYNLYQTSAYKSLVKWCAIVGTGAFGTASGFNTNTVKWQQNVNSWVTKFQQTNYLKVTGNKPVICVMYDAAELVGWFSNDINNATTAIAYLRTQCIAAGLGTPYIVLMAGSSSVSHALLGTLGADCLSNYISSFSHTAIPTPYTTLASQTEAWWASGLANLGDPIAPICMAGWDTRARRSTPESWAKSTPRSGISTYMAIGTGAEIATHLQAGITYIDNNPSKCPEKLMFVYSWTECDEGGALIPTIADPPVNATVNDAYSGLLTSNMLNGITPTLLAAA